MSSRTKQGIEVAITYLILFFLWTAYRIFFRLPEWVDEFIAKPLLWLTPLFLLRKKLVLFFNNQPWKSISNSILLGLSIGVLYFFLYTLLSAFQVGFPTFNATHLSNVQILLQLAIACSTGYIEEIVFRRYMLEESLLMFNDRIIANSFVTLLFVLIHLPIIFFVYKYSFASTISYLAVLTISSFIYGLVYLHKKSLLASSLTHAVWNFLGTIIR